MWIINSRKLYLSNNPISYSDALNIKNFRKIESLKKVEKKIAMKKENKLRKFQFYHIFQFFRTLFYSTISSFHSLRRYNTFPFRKLPLLLQENLNLMKFKFKKIFLLPLFSFLLFITRKHTI